MQAEFTKADLEIIKQCVEVATFQGNSVRMVSQLLDKIEIQLEEIALKQPAKAKS